MEVSSRIFVNFLSACYGEKDEFIFLRSRPVKCYFRLFSNVLLSSKNVVLSLLITCVLGAGKHGRLLR